ncbi:MAG: hypothetical protein LBQ79_01495 [Deltaproteobacteria bacterium]|jgi:hypothetical protein|nr:hypothetical protein [Deltaproteobacteria bacterium]
MRDHAKSLPALMLTLAALAASACGCSGGPIPPGAPKADWERTYGGSGDDEIYAVAPSDDGGFVLAGYSSSSDGDLPGTRTGEDAWIMKVGPSGDPQWHTVLGGDLDDVAMTVSAAPGGGYLVGGFTWSEDGNFKVPDGALPRADVPGAPPGARPGLGRQGPRRGWAGKVDSGGRVLWTRVYGKNGIYGINSVAPAAGGGLIAVGDIMDPSCRRQAGEPFSYDVWVLRLDPAGEVLWEKCIGGAFNDLPVGAVETEDGGLVLAATARSRDRQPGTPSLPGEGAWIAALGPGGETLWERRYSGNGAEWAFSLRPVSRNGFVMAGMHGAPGPDPSTRKNSAVKIGPGGEVDWTAAPGGQGRLTDVIPVAGGYLAVLVPTAGARGPGRGRKHPHDVVLVRLGAGGAEEWRRGYGDAEGRPATAFALTSDGGMAAAGTVKNPIGPGQKGDKDAWALKLSPR